MEYILRKDKHDGSICTEIGAAAGQEAGGWSLGHRQEGTNVILTLPDGAATKAQLDAVVAAHQPAEPAVDPKAQVLAGIAAASSLTALKAALTKWIGG